MQENYQSYLEYYAKHIRPAINELDIAIKCKSRLGNKELAEILGSNVQEIEKIRNTHDLKTLNQRAIVKIMQESNSDICKMFQRELELGSPLTYSLEEFSYIYNFDINLVCEVCQNLNINEVTWQNMPSIFAALPYEQ